MRVPCISSLSASSCVFFFRIAIDLSFQFSLYLPWGSPVVVWRVVLTFSIKYFRSSRDSSTHREYWVKDHLLNKSSSFLDKKMNLRYLLIFQLAFLYTEIVCEYSTDSDRILEMFTDSDRILEMFVVVMLRGMLEHSIIIIRV